MAEKQGLGVAISRQMGSGGSYIGYALAKKLDFKFVDREILHKAAKQLGVDETLLQERDEKSSSFLDSIARLFSFGSPEAAYMPPIIRPVYDRDLFDLQCKIMNEILDRDNAVIVGRGGFYALKDRPGILRVLIHAPMDLRMKRVMKVSNMTDIGEARAKVEESDQRRAKFIRDIVGVEWMDARNYHLCIDTSVVSFEDGVDMIIRLIGKNKKA